MTVINSTKYEADSGSIHSVRLRPETAAAAGTPPAGAVDSEIPVKVSKSNGEYGIRPRGLSLFRVIGTGATASRVYRFLPILTPTAWLTFNREDSVTIGGNTWTVVNRVPEDL